MVNNDEERNNLNMKRESEGQEGRRIAEDMIEAGKLKTAKAQDVLDSIKSEEGQLSAAELLQISSAPRKAKFKKTGKIRKGLQRYNKKYIQGSQPLDKIKKIKFKKGLKSFARFTGERNYIVLANGQHRFISKKQYAKLRRQNKIPKVKRVFYSDSGIDPNDNIFEQEHQFQENQFNRKERSRWRNTEHFSMPTRRVQQRLKELDNQQRFQNDPSVNLLMAHRRMLSSQENSIFKTERSKNILDTKENNLLRRNENSIDINRLSSPEILAAPNLFSKQNPYNDEKILNNPNNKLNFGNVELQRNPKNKIQKKNIPARISFWR